MLRNTFLFALLLIILGMAVACRNDTQDADGDEARILYADARLCACCGGWFVEVKQDTLRIDKMPDDFQKMLYAAKPSEFPMPVIMVWEPKVPACLGDEIIVTQISRR